MKKKHCCLATETWRTLSWFCGSCLSLTRSNLSSPRSYLFTLFKIFATHLGHEYTRHYYLTKTSSPCSVQRFENIFHPTLIIAGNRSEETTSRFVSIQFDVDQTSSRCRCDVIRCQLHYNLKMTQRLLIIT